MNRSLLFVGLLAACLLVNSQASALERGAIAKRGWGPEQATGEPDTPVAGDQTTAWASATPDGADEWLELEYAAPVLVEAVLVHETYNPGALFKIVGYTDSGMDAELWAGEDPTPRGAGKGVSEIALKGTLETKRIRLHLKSKEVPGWNEIDAVGLRDAKGKVHWAVSAKASSTFGAGIAPAAGLPFGVPIGIPDIGFAPPAVVVGGGKRAWGAEQATGEPDTPRAGDQATAWASATPDGADEWLELEYDEALKIETVKVHETFNPGALYKVTGFNEAGKEEDLWEGKDPTDAKEEKGVSEIPVKGKLKTKRIRIYLKSKDVVGWNEIDAVAIKDADGKQLLATKAKASSDYGAAFGGFVEVIDGGIAGPIRVAIGVPDVGPPVPVAPPAPPGPRGAPRDPRDARLEKLEKEMADLKKSLDEIRKLLEKPR